MNINAHEQAVLSGFTFQKCMKNCQGLVPDLLDEICLWMMQADATDADITNVQIVLGEALNNIIKHGFESEGSGRIELKISLMGDGIVVRLCDDGIAFTPPEISDTPLQGKNDLKNLPEGGFGWFLIKQITSSIEFTRFTNRNYLVLKFG